MAAYLFGLDGGTQGEGLEDTVGMAADRLRLWALDELASWRVGSGCMVLVESVEARMRDTAAVACGAAAATGPPRTAHSTPKRRKAPDPRRGRALGPQSTEVLQRTSRRT